MIQGTQIPTPPPFDPNLFFMNDNAAPVIVMIVLASLAAATIILWPIMRAIGRRMEHKAGPDPALRGELEQLQHRLAEVDVLQARLAELEERLDFAERLLAQNKDPERLPR
jgi:Tfp pilus assembly protein PilO